MTDNKIAAKDIVVRNDAGQHVVVVPAGQPIPDDLDAQKALVAGSIARTATDDEVAAARGESKSKK